MTKDARVTPALRTRLTASGALLLLALGAAAPAMARTAVEHSPGDVQVEEVASSAPVTIDDLAATPASVTATYYCAVRDGTFGCTNDSPGEGLVVAELFQHAGFGGWRIVVFNPAYSVGCSSSTGDNEGGANLFEFANAVTSVKTYNSCDVKFFDGNNKSGAATGFIDRDDNLGSFNDRANSFAIS
ncbi:hypothetical protein [Promicromonospora sp. NFX87]|uniref:hypothetical protein n=1 Tax=Promicromonospora sp. NFX87 TaxID=3402691 RepID=UPI003AFA1B14